MSAVPVPKQGPVTSETHPLEVTIKILKPGPPTVYIDETWSASL